MARERLYRSRRDRMLFGVAGGMAEWMGLDPAIVRLVWALLVVFGGAGLILYIVAIFVIPEEPFAAAAAAEAAADRDDEADATPPADPVAAEAWRADRERRRAERAARRTERWAARPRDGRGAVIFGVVLVVVGLWFLARNFLPFLDERLFGPGLLILVGGVFIVLSLGRRD